MPEKLRVIAVAGHLVADDLAYQNGNRFRYVGRSKTPTKNPNPALSNSPIEQRFPPEEQEYPNDFDHRYILRQIKKGALLPCDEFTAKLAGVAFQKTGKTSAASAQKGSG